MQITEGIAAIPIPSRESRVFCKVAMQVNHLSKPPTLPGMVAVCLLQITSAIPQLIPNCL